MILEISDWKFRVDAEATQDRTAKYSYEHCQCSYCKNFYDAIDTAHPYLRPAMAQFGIYLEGPSELMPFEPTLIMACYRVDGEILQWGKSRLSIRGIPVVPEAADDHTFLLWVGEFEIPWLQEEAPETVVSPANLPEFMERMQEIWLLRHGNDILIS